LVYIDTYNRRVSIVLFDNGKNIQQESKVCDSISFSLNLESGKVKVVLRLDDIIISDDISEHTPSLDLSSFEFNLNTELPLSMNLNLNIINQTGNYIENNQLTGGNIENNQPTGGNIENNQIRTGKPTRTPRTTPSKKQRKKKDPNVPKNPRNAWIFFSVEKRKELKEKHSDWDHKMVNKKVSKMWKAMTPEEKEPYDEQAAEDIKRFETEMEESQKKGGGEAKSEETSKSED